MALFVEEYKHKAAHYMGNFCDESFDLCANNSILMLQVDEAYALLNEFLKLPECDKAKYLRKQGSQQGWVPLDTERLVVCYIK